MRMKLQTTLCLSVICLLLMIPKMVWAATFSLYVGPSENVTERTDGRWPADAVKVYQRDQKWYLLLPASWDCSTLHVYYDGTKPLTVDGTEVPNGEATEAFQPGKRVKVKLHGGGEYLINVMQSANIPAMFITTESGNIDAIRDDKTAKEPGYLLVQDADGTVEYDGQMDYIKTRGNATFFFSKKPFQIKLDKGASLCGMKPNKKWILLANYMDKSLVRNSVCLDMARAAGVYAYVPEYQPVDLYINHTYWGNYLLTEKNEVDDNRLNIYNLEKTTEKMNETPLEEMETFGERLYTLGGTKGYRVPNEPDDFTGGYLLLANSRVYFANEPSGFVTERGQAFTLESPKHASEKQVKYTQQLMQSIENALFAEDGTDPATGKHYTEMLDFSTFLHRYLQAEITCEYDGQKPYFYKDNDAIDPKVYCGPLWDLDNTFGANVNQTNARRFYIQNDESQKYYWFVQAMKRPEFRAAAIQTYWDTYEPLLRVLLGQSKDPNGILHSVEEYGAAIAASAEMDNIRWPIAQLRQDNFNPKTGATPVQNIQYLAEYIERRLEFLNKEWAQ